MNFLRSRAEHLADHLREQIERGDLAEPLPGTRDWANQLNVGRKTLDEALRILSREGLITVRAREGASLRAKPQSQSQGDFHRGKVARILYYGREYPEISHSLGWFTALSARLQSRQIQLTLEKCSHARLVEISEYCGRSPDLHFLLSLSPSQQRLFARHSAKVVIVGSPADGIPLSSVNTDVVGAVRHATNELLRRGHSSLSLLDGKATAPSVNQAAVAFRRACAEWPHQPVNAEVVLFPLELHNMVVAAARFAGRIRTRRGIIVITPVSVSAVMTALLSHGVSIPSRAEIAAVFTIPEFLTVYPIPTHYPLPVDSFARALTEVAVHYFETGSVPSIHKTIGTQMIAGG